MLQEMGQKWQKYTNVHYYSNPVRELKKIKDPNISGWSDKRRNLFFVFCELSSKVNFSSAYKRTICIQMGHLCICNESFQLLSFAVFSLHLSKHCRCEVGLSYSEQKNRTLHIRISSLISHLVVSPFPRFLFYSWILHLILFDILPVWDGTRNIHQTVSPDRRRIS